MFLHLVRLIAQSRNRQVAGAAASVGSQAGQRVTSLAAKKTRIETCTGKKSQTY
jgi:hypothetical protein